MTTGRKNTGNYRHNISSTSFLAFDNFQNVYHIFLKFLQDKYSLEVNEGNLDIKKIVFETMHKVSKDDNLSEYNLVDLNKVTLSIVKNVVKNKLSIDNTFNSSLIRNREIEKKNVNLHTFNRPVPTSDHRAGDVASKFKIESSVRSSDKAVPQPGAPADIATAVDENALTNDEFKEKLALLEKTRNKDNKDRLDALTSMETTTDSSTIDHPPTSSSVRESFQPNQFMDDVFNTIHPDSTNPKDLYESNNEFNESLVNALNTINNTTTKFSKEYHEPLEKQRTILEEKYLLINSQDRNWLRDEKRYEYSIFFTNQSRNDIQEPFYENNPTIPHTKGTGGQGIANLTGWVDPATSAAYPKYDPDADLGAVVGYEDVENLIELNSSVGNVFKNIHSLQVNKVIIPLNIFLLNKHNFNVAAIEIDSANRDYDFNINFPYVLLKIDELGNVYQGTDETTRKSFCQLVYESSFKCPNGRGYIVLKPTQNERKVFYPTSLSSLSTLTFSLLKPNGELLNDSKDGLSIFKIKSSSINNNRLLQVVTNRYFSRNDFYKGDVIRIKNFNVYKIKNNACYSDSSIRKFNDFVNRNQGHEIVELGEANPNGYYKFFYIKSMVSFDDVTGTDVVDDSIVSSIAQFETDLQEHEQFITSDAFMNGHIINLSLQNSITVSLKQHVHDSKVVASETVF